MPSVINSITTFITSIFNAIFSIFTGLIGLVQDFLNVVITAFSTFFGAIGASIKELAVTFEGLTKFLVSKSTPLFFNLCELRNDADNRLR